MAAPKQKKMRSRLDRLGRRRVAIVALAVFLALDVALVAWAVGAHSAAPDGGSVPAAADSPPSGSTDSGTPTPPSTPKATATTPAAPVVAAAAVTPTRLLSALDSNTAWRSVTGSCPSKPPSPELTTDGGANWKQSDVNGPTGAAAVLALHVQSSSTADMVVLNSTGCSVQYVQTYVAGDNWAEYPDRLGGTWYLNPAKPAVVHGPQGEKAAPCPTVVALASRDDASAAVLCSDHHVFRTTNAATSWSEAVTIPGSVNVAAGGDGYLVAVANQASCKGIRVVTLANPAAGPASSAGACRGVAFAPGEVTLAQSGSTVWLWAGAQLSRSNDGGASWQ